MHPTHTILNTEKSAMLYTCIFLSSRKVVGGKETRMIGSTVPAILLRRVVLVCFVSLPLLLFLFSFFFFFFFFF